MSFFKKLGRWTVFIGKFIVAILTFPIFLRRVRRQKRDDEVIIFPLAHIGDTIYAMMYVAEFKRETGKKIHICCCENVLHIVKRYSCVDEITTFKKFSLKECYVRCFSIFRYIGIRKENRDGLYPTNPRRSFFRGKTIIEIYRDKIFKVQADNRELLVPEIVPIKSIPNFEENKDKIIVLNPYSYSQIPNKKLYKTIVKELNDLGYIVYTNAVARLGQKAIKGSLMLDCSPDELYSIVQEIPLFLSMRSGIIDYVVGGKANIFAIYTMLPSMKNFYSVKELTCYDKYKGKVDEFVWIRNSDTEWVIRRIKAFLQNINKN